MTGMTLAKTGREIDQLRDLTLRMGGLAEASLALGLRAIWTRQQALCRQVVRDDVAIDRLDVAIDSAVLSLLARRAPVASDLRRVLAVKTIATDLERIGDLARDIAHAGRRIAARPPRPPSPRLRELAEAARRALSRALRAFADLDADLARAVIEAREEIDALEGDLIRESIARIQQAPATGDHQVDIILIARSLEHVADHTVRLAEEVLRLGGSANLTLLETRHDP